MKRCSLVIPLINIEKVYDESLDITFYELYLNDIYIRRFESIDDLNKHVCMIIKDESRSCEVK